MTLRSRVLLAFCIGTIFALVALLSGCGDSNLAAKVNGTGISEKTLDSEMAILKLQNPTLFDTENGGMDEATIRKTLLDELVRQQLVLEQAKKDGIEVSDAEVQKNVAAVKSGYADEAQFKDALSSAGFTVSSYEKQVKWQLILAKVIEKQLPASALKEKDLKAYYDKNKSKYKVEAAKRSSHILFATADKDEAQKVLKELKAGANFEALARKYSTDTASAESGGDLGWPTQEYVKEFQNAVDKLDKGEISGLVKSAYGWHIIKVTDVRKAGQQTYKEARETVEQDLLSDKRKALYNTMLKRLESEADIKIYDKTVKNAKSSVSTDNSDSGAQGGTSAGTGETSK